MVKVIVNGTSIEIPEGYDVNVNGAEVTLNPVDGAKAPVASAEQAPAEEPDNEAAAKLDDDGERLDASDLKRVLELLKHYDYLDSFHPGLFDANIEYTTLNGADRSYRGWRIDPSTFDNEAVTVKITNGDEWRTLKVNHIDTVTIPASVEALADLAN